MSPRLRRADCSSPGLTRRRQGKGFTYLDADGEKVSEPEDLARISELGIPPAWKDVWICPDARGHLQATGIDAAGRKQYLYHPQWRTRRDSEKFDEMTRFARALPALREHVDADLTSSDELTRERVLACAVRLLDRGFFRIGSEQYTVQNESFGLATMRKEHVTPRSRARRHGVRLRRQERQAPDPGRARPGRLRGRRRAQAPPRRGRRAARVQARPLAGAICARPTSTSTSRRPPAPTTRPRTSAPGARRCSPRSPWRSRARSRARRPAASARSSARSRRSPTTSATRPRSAAPPTSTRA